MTNATERVSHLTAGTGTNIPIRGLKLPPPKPPRFSLSLKIFLAAALLILIAVGGAIYSVGAGVHRWRSLRFHNAIWHAMVVIAAACQFVAVLRGVVLAGP